VHRRGRGTRCSRGVAGARLVVPAGDAPVPLQVVEEAFHPIAQAIERSVVPTLLGSFLPGWDHGLEATSLELLENLVGVVVAVGNAGIPRDEVDQPVRHRTVVPLSRGDQDFQRATVEVDDGMDLRRPATPRAPDVVFLGPPRPPAES